MSSNECPMCGCQAFDEIDGYLCRSDGMRACDGDRSVCGCASWLSADSESWHIAFVDEEET